MFDNNVAVIESNDLTSCSKSNHSTRNCLNTTRRTQIVVNGMADTQSISDRLPNQIGNITSHTFIDQIVQSEISINLVNHCAHPYVQYLHKSFLVGWHCVSS
ncbi:hypothetical protein BDEG_28726 [Batrachochytrium dendrobatidis JEL423]|uniref:Uncharacterized protein n=1 Tax=Batrachochytrium dendrobatidis (strain JEL423) TaxID=403673 RepID=A0A177VYE3_BATDL|nr:hypothetical protein BDEG_28726 [Batrachochytrium dendrobatidis JEL423]